MNNILTEKDRIDYVKTQIQRGICLPYDPKIFSNLRFWVGKLPNEEKRFFTKEIYEWFYGGRNEHGRRG